MPGYPRKRPGSVPNKDEDTRCRFGYNRRMNVSSQVPPSANGMLLSAYLAKRFTYLPEADWCQLISEGRISRDGVVCNLATTVNKGDRICCDMPEFEAPEVNLDYSVVYEDDWLLAVNKPAGLRVHSGGKFVTANLVYHLRHVRRPAFPEACLVNRLDADTSGLVLFARSKTVLSQLMQQFAEGSVTKTYLAVATGHPNPEEGIVDLPIGALKEAIIPRYGIDDKRGKPAITRYRTLRQLGKGHTLLELQPESGRTHQLRVHMAAIGHPLAGDALYTMNDEDYLTWQRNPALQNCLKRQALHSHKLQFLHPVHQTTCTLTAPLAPDLERYISDLTR